MVFHLLLMNFVYRFPNSFIFGYNFLLFIYNFIYSMCSLGALSRCQAVSYALGMEL